MHKFVWVGPILMLLLAVAVLMFFGLSAWTAILVTFLLACPVIILWGITKVFGRQKEIPLEPAPHTNGMLLEWIAPVYDWYCPKIGLGPRFRKLTLRYAGIKPAELVLDVGCGTGVLTRLAADVVGPNGRVIGIDPGPKMIGIARKNATLESSRAEFRLAAIENLPFEDKNFDCVLSSFMVHHLPPDLKLKGLAEVHRVLKPGGRLLVVDIDKPANPLWWLVLWPLFFWSFTKDQVSGRLGNYFMQAGFSEVERAGGRFGCLSFWKAYKGK